MINDRESFMTINLLPWSAYNILFFKKKEKKLDRYKPVLKFHQKYKTYCFIKLWNKRIGSGFMTINVCWYNKYIMWCYS